MLGSKEAGAPQPLRLCSRAQEPQLLSPCVSTPEARVLRASASQQEESPSEKPEHTNDKVAPTQRN